MIETNEPTSRIESLSPAEILRWKSLLDQVTNSDPELKKLTEELEANDPEAQKLIDGSRILTLKKTIIDEISNRLNSGYHRAA